MLKDGIFFWCILMGVGWFVGFVVIGGIFVWLWVYGEKLFDVYMFVLLKEVVIKFMNFGGNFGVNVSGLLKGCGQEGVNVV